MDGAPRFINGRDKFGYDFFGIKWYTEGKQFGELYRLKDGQTTDQLRVKLDRKATRFDKLYRLMPFRIWKGFVGWLYTYL